MNLKVMIFVAILLIFTTLDVYGLRKGEPSDAHCHLTIYTLVSDLVCAPELMLYNFTHSVTAAVRFANSLMPVNNTVIFLAASKHR